MPSRAEVVAQQPLLERSKHLTTNARPENLSRCKRQRLGMLCLIFEAPYSTNGIWLFVGSGTLVSSNPPNKCVSSSTTANRLRSSDNSFDDSSISQRQVETLRMEAIRSRFGSSEALGVAARQLMLADRQLMLADTPTNRAYRSHHYLFILWTQFHKVHISNYLLVGVINFMADLQYYKNYQVSNLLLSRTVITYFHLKPATIRNSAVDGGSSAACTSGVSLGDTVKHTFGTFNLSIEER
ncbi:hypothetical protein BD560DRAFT_406177 [Blakeslea trispora]|nr:hypothetical protein BD560DRAFT_406177 [Blakeslea trispora]